MNCELFEHEQDELDAPEPTQEDYEGLAEETAEEAEIAQAVARQKAWEQQMAQKGLICMADMAGCPRVKAEPILEKLIYPGSLTILAGDPKIGKTTFLLHALNSLDLMGRIPFCGMRTRQVRVLYASEQSYPSLDSQVQRLPEYDQNRHVWFIPYEFNRDEKIDFPRTWEMQLKLWERRLRECRAKLLVVDTFMAFAQLKGGEAFDSGPITKRLQGLRTLQNTIPDLAIVLNHHLRKEDTNGTGKRSFSDIANSYAFRASSDTNIIMYQTGGKNTRQIQIESRYLNEPEELTFYKIGNTFTEDADWGHKVEKVQKAVEDDPSLLQLSTRDLAKKLNVGKGTICRFKETKK